MIFILHVINLPFLTMIRLLTWCYKIITHSHRTILVWKDIFNSDCEQFYQYQQQQKNTYLAWDRHNKYGRVQSVREALVSRYLFQAFFMASVRCASINYEEQQHIARKDQFRPYILPACLCPSLCTSQQAEWWSAMYKFCTGKAKENFPKLRSTLQRGLEVIRLQGTHGLSVVAVANIARTFDQRVCILYTNNYLYLAWPCELLPLWRIHCLPFIHHCWVFFDILIFISETILGKLRQTEVRLKAAALFTKMCAINIYCKCEMKIMKSFTKKSYDNRKCKICHKSTTKTNHSFLSVKYLS